jgi:predicted metal-dependent enzyme (double-stranded beta helix superfamily)
MTVSTHITELEIAIRNILQQTSLEKEIVKQLKPHFDLFLKTKDLLPATYKQPKKNKYSQLLLYKPEDEAFSIVGFVWGSGQTAPIHDHLVWGLVGIYEGAIEETRYRRVKGSQGDYTLEKVEVVTAKAQDISYVYPPNADIHSVRNPFAEPAITIHLYGTDIGSQERHIYDEFASPKNIVTAHENDVPLYT